MTITGLQDWTGQEGLKVLKALEKVRGGVRFFRSAAYSSDLYFFEMYIY